MSLLGAFETIKKWFGIKVGNVGITILICMLSMTALLIFWNLCKAAIGKSKIVVKWGQLVTLIVLVFLIVWLCLMY